jgi:hypothetical protein
VANSSNHARSRDRLGQRKLARAAAALMSLALLLPARFADRKKSLLPFGRRGGLESGLLNAPRLSSLLLGFASRLRCSLGRFRGRSLCGFARSALSPPCCTGGSASSRCRGWQSPNKRREPDPRYAPSAALDRGDCRLPAVPRRLRTVGPWRSLAASSLRIHSKASDEATHVRAAAGRSLRSVA